MLRSSNISGSYAETLSSGYAQSKWVAEQVKTIHKSPGSPRVCGVLK